MEDVTDWSSAGYDRDVIDRVWRQAAEIAGNDPALWRKDECGAWIYRLDYGRRHSDFGWEIHDPTVGLRGGGAVLSLGPSSGKTILTASRAKPNAASPQMACGTPGSCSVSETDRTNGANGPYQA